MIIFTYYGGMEAVIWVEVVQLLIYIGGAIAAAVVILKIRLTAVCPRVCTSENNSINSDFRFRFRYHENFYVLGGTDRRLFSNDVHARHGSISCPTLSLHRQTEPRITRITFKRRGCFGTIYRVSVYRRFAFCFLPTVCNVPVMKRQQARFHLRAAIRFFPIL